MSKKFFIETVGCQMNVLDSELATAGLIESGYEPALRLKDADIILFNTCSVREHAEEKIYSALGRLKHWKEYHPDGVLGVMGCMAQKDQKIIFRRAPHVDLVLGPGRLDRLPDLISTILHSRQPALEISLDRDPELHAATEIRDSFHLFDPIRLPVARLSVQQAMVRIMFGCNKFCSYCIVPRVRGPEQSRPAADIVSEITTLVQQGCREVTLIGQTVNNWRAEENGRRLVMADLLERIDAINGIERIRFVSNYPTGMTDDLLQAVRDLPKVMPFIHVPAQHGANSVLKRMRRMYTVEEYRDLLDRIYAIIPGVSVTSDFIVGFCGETEEEFAQTVELVRYGRFKNSFIFKYSPREGTKSAREFEDDVPEADKKRRNNELLDLQTQISTAENARFVGKTVEILVEGPSRNQIKEEKNDRLSLVSLTIPKQANTQSNPSDTAVVQLTGRTPCDRIVVFDGPVSLTGQLVQIRVTQSHPFTLLGELTQKGLAD